MTNTSKNEKFNKYENHLFEPEINDNNKDLIPRPFNLCSPRTVENAKNVKKENEKRSVQESKESVADEKDKKQDFFLLNTKITIPRFPVLIITGILLAGLSWLIIKRFTRRNYKKKKGQ